MEIVLLFILIIVPLASYYVNNIYCNFAEELLWGLFFVITVFKIVRSHNIHFKIVDIFYVIFIIIVITYHLNYEIAEASIYKDLIYILTLWFISHQSVVRNKRLIHVLIVAGCIHCLLSFELFEVAVSVPMRGIMGNSGIWGIYIAMLLPLSFGEFLFSGNRYYKFIFLVISLLFLIVIFWSQSRSAFIAGILSCLYLVIKCKPYLKLFIHKVYIQMIVVIACVLLGILLYRIRSDSIKGRLFVYTTTVNMISEKPILGCGYNGFKLSYLDYQARYFQNHPNSIFEKYADNTEVCFNEFLQITAEYGIVGLFLVMSLLLLIFYLLEAKINDNTFCILKGGLLSLIVVSLFSYPLRREGTLLVAIVLVGSLLTYTEEYILRRYKMIMSIYVFASLFFYMNYCRYMINQKKGYTLWEKARGQNDEMEKQLMTYREASKYLGANMSFLCDYSAVLYEKNSYKDAAYALNQLLTFKNKYDVYIVLGDCYEKMMNAKMAEFCYKQAHYMIPNRFIPLYKLMLLYKQTSQNVKLQEVAMEICEKNIKIPSYTIEKIKTEACGILKE